MWTLAASFSSQFQLIRNALHGDVRNLLEALETDAQNKQPDTHSISIEQVQSWVLLAIYELMSDTCNYQRGIISAGRAFRLVQMLRLYEMDKTTDTTPKSSGQQPQDDWIDAESMRRTFWLAYTVDRYTSVVDGLHLAFDERQVRLDFPYMLPLQQPL